MTANEIDIVVKYVDHSAAPMAETHSRAEKLRSAFGRVGAYAAGAFSAHVVYAGIAKFKDFMGEATTAASDLHEAVNAVQDVFGKSQNVILNWGKTNANSIGLSQRAFLEAATPLGAMLRNQGLGMKDVTTRTIDLTKRAADMASVFNTSVPDALEAIQAGIRGEQDPLERYGVSLTAAKVQAEAMAETHKKAAGDLTSTELATARLNLIMKQTNSTAGDFHKTSGALANSQRIEAARVEDLQAKLGSRLLPATLMLTKAKLALAGVMADKVVPAFNAISAWLMKHPALLKALGIIVGVLLVAAFYAWASAAAMAAAATIAATWPVIAIIAAVAALAVGIHFAYTHWRVFHDVVNTVGRFLKGPFLDAVKTVTGWVVTGFRFMVMAVTGYIGIFLSAAAKAFGWIPGIGPKLREARDKFYQFRDDANRALGGIKDQNVNIKLTVQEQHRTDASTMSGNFVRGLRTGGIVGYAAGGGPRGRTWVGEEGAELVDLPPGTMVHSHPDSMHLAGGGGGQKLEIEWVGGSGGDEFLSWLRKNIRIRGGNVQDVLGKA